MGISEIKINENWSKYERKPGWCLNYSDMMRNGGENDVVYEEQNVPTHNKIHQGFLMTLIMMINSFQC